MRKVLFFVIVIALAGTRPATAQFFPSIWLDKLDVRATSPTAPGSPDCEAVKPESVISATTMKRLNETIQVVEMSGRQAMSDIYPLLGHCVSPNGSHNLAEERIIPELRSFFSEPGKYMGLQKGRDADYVENMPRVRKDDGQLATNEDWVAVDLIARTLYSEVSSNPKCGPEYTAAVGKIILNRMDAAIANPADRQRFARKNISGVHPVVPVLLMPNQFAVWRGNDAANRWAACPAKQSQQVYEYRDRKGKRVESGRLENNQWFLAMETAIEMVFHGDEFRRKTRDFPYYFYTTGRSTHTARVKEGFRHRANATIGGKVVNHIECAEVWEGR